MSGKEVEAKALDLMAPLLGAERAHRTIEAIRTIDTAPSLKGLAALICGPPINNHAH
jgi:hypothetical protein